MSTVNIINNLYEDIGAVERKVNILPALAPISIEALQDKLVRLECMVEDVEDGARSAGLIPMVPDAPGAPTTDPWSTSTDAGDRAAQATEAIANAMPTDYSRQVTDEDDDRLINDTLLQFGRDLTDDVRQNLLDPIVGRDDEIRRIIHILCRKTKNNPVLIGEPGVGKTAIVEGLAHRIIKGDVPDSLKEKVIYSLDLGSLMAGAGQQGELEARMKMILEHIRDNDGQIILFIDEVHTMVGLGAGNGVDIGNMMKPMLARGELHCVGATTLNEYRENIEKDTALERRFQSILVEEPSLDDTLCILRGIKGAYEVHHGVTVKDDAIVAAVELSHRYITDRYNPDKAIDLMDEACARVRTELESLPASLDGIVRKIKQLEIEETALMVEAGDPTIDARLETIRAELGENREQNDILMEQWVREKEAINSVNRLRSDLTDARNELEVCERKNEYERAGELSVKLIPELETELAENEAVLEEINGGALLHDAINEDEIAQIVAKWTGIPVASMNETEAQKVLAMPEKLHERVIGQSVPVQKISDAIIRSRSGIKNPDRPIGSFLFLGPTGVGKTELAKAVAEAMFDSEQQIIRLDMSEYMEGHNVSRLFGAPPGYIGFEQGGQLTEQVRRKPYSVILFDEVEKAHPQVFNALLQILDDGRCTDGQGRTVDFKNTVIIMTSNIGAHYILDGMDESGEVSDEAQEKVTKLLKQHFRPEFLNRVDETIMFKALTKDELMGIVELGLKDIRERLADRDITVEITEEAKKFVVDKAYDPAYGARPLNRFLASKLETNIGKAILGGDINEGDTLTIDVEDGNLIIGVGE